MSTSHARSVSQSHPRPGRVQSPPPQPTTPLRPPSRGSLRSSNPPTHQSSSAAIASLEPAFAELSDGMADLEANFMHLQIMHESLARFNECFASFLYGMTVNGFCSDFTEAPVAESFRRAQNDPRFAQAQQQHADLSTPRRPGAGNMFSRSINSEAGFDPDQTFLTTDTSFVENPPSAVKPRSAAPAGRGRGTARGAAAGRGTAGRGGARESSIPAPRGRTNGAARASARGTRGASTTRGRAGAKSSMR